MEIVPRIGLTTVQHVRKEFDGDWYVRASTYDESIISAGGIPVSIPAMVPETLLDRYLDLLDGMIFIGGMDIPSALLGEKPDPKVNPMPEFVILNHLSLVRKVFARKIPVLGVCLGMQELNVANGGKLIQDLGGLVPYHRQPGRDQYPRGIIEAGSRLAEILGPGELLLNSCHHQAVDPDHVAPGARIAARCGNVVEAIEFEGDVFRIGVQWHPERIKNEEHRRKFFAAFISCCRTYRISRGKSDWS